MSAAANNWLKDRPLITVLSSFLGSLILAFTIRAVNIDDDKQKTFNETLLKKADIEYVDKSIRIHEEKEREIFTPMQKDLTDIKNYLFYNKLPDKTD